MKLARCQKEKKKKKYINKINSDQLEICLSPIKITPRSNQFGPTGLNKN